MEATYITRGIIIKREPRGEDGARVIVYTADQGKLDLVARGTAKIKSKLAGHLEPLTLASLMVVKGKRFDYIGSARSENCHRGIKGDYGKITAAGEAARLFNGLIKTGAKDAKIFELLASFLAALDSWSGRTARLGLLGAFFFLKLLAMLGYRPELGQCAVCRPGAAKAASYFSARAGGLVCRSCRTGQPGLTISPGAVKIMKAVLDNKFGGLLSINPEKKLQTEIIRIVKHYSEYYREDTAGQAAN
jgi:DNA repair protein RecO (recombination protein O)